MPLAELEALNREWLTAAQIAEVLDADPNYIRRQAHEDASKLGFPVIVIGSRVKILLVIGLFPIFILIELLKLSN